jgi:hypothetical protein
VLQRLLAFDHEQDDELWMLLDTDHYTEGSHLQSFIAALSEARRQGINVALSTPCFELSANCFQRARTKGLAVWILVAQACAFLRDGAEAVIAYNEPSTPGLVLLRAALARCRLAVRGH